MDLFTWWSCEQHIKVGFSELSLFPKIAFVRSCHVGYADICQVFGASCGHVTSTFRKLRVYSAFATHSSISTGISSGTGARAVSSWVSLHHYTQSFKRSAENVKVFSSLNSFRAALSHHFLCTHIWNLYVAYAIVNGGSLLMHGSNNNGLKNIISQKLEKSCKGGR